MPVVQVEAADHYLVARGETEIAEVYEALPQELRPPFPPLELPGGVMGLVSRGGFGQTFFFAAEVLGVSFRTSAGRLVQAGGRVIKNVQGYDLVRPFVGSFGLLGEAQEVVLRLRPARAAALWRYQREGELKPRFVWWAEGERYAYHFGHPRELQRAGYAPELKVDGLLDYRGYFSQGMGVGEEGPLRDERFVWCDGCPPPRPPERFMALARALDERGEI